MQLLQQISHHFFLVPVDLVDCAVNLHLHELFVSSVKPSDVQMVLYGYGLRFYWTPKS